MVTVNDLIKMKDTNIGGVTLEQAFNNRDNLPGLVASKIDSNTPGGMFGTGIRAGDALNFIRNPGQVATNMGINAGVNEISKRTGLGSTPIAAGLSLLQGGSLKDVASSAATSYASGALFAANPVLGGVSTVMNAIGLGGMNPLNLVGDVIGGIFGGLFGGAVDNRVSKEEDARNRNAVNTLLDPNEIANSGGESIAKLADFTVGLLNDPSKPDGDIAHQIDDVKCRIRDLAYKMPDGPEKTALKKLSDDIDKSFSRSPFATNPETASKLKEAFGNYYTTATGNTCGNGSTDAHNNHAEKHIHSCQKPHNSHKQKIRARNHLARLAMEQMIASNPRSNGSETTLHLTIKR